MSNKPYAISPDLWMVPCLVHRSSNDYEPLYKPFKAEILADKLQVRQTWLASEDDTLKEIVSENGAKNWISIATSLNEKVHKGLPIRQGKQCRERWFNHLSPSLQKGKWSGNEDLTILEKQKEIGNRWSEIASLLDGRTENQVKNRFKSLMRKMKTMDKSEEESFSILIERLRDGNLDKPCSVVVPTFINNPLPLYPYQGMNTGPFQSLSEVPPSASQSFPRDEASALLFYHT